MQAAPDPRAARRGGHPAAGQAEHRDAEERVGGERAERDRSRPVAGGERDERAASARRGRRSRQDRRDVQDQDGQPEPGRTRGAGTARRSGGRRRPCRDTARRGRWRRQQDQRRQPGAARGEPDAHAAAPIGSTAGQPAVVVTDAVARDEPGGETATGQPARRPRPARSRRCSRRWRPAPSRPSDASRCATGRRRGGRCAGRRCGGPAGRRAARCGRWWSRWSGPPWRRATSWPVAALALGDPHRPAARAGRRPRRGPRRARPAPRCRSGRPGSARRGRRSRPWRWRRGRGRCRPGR